MYLSFLTSKHRCKKINLKLLKYVSEIHCSFLPLTSLITTGALYWDPPYGVTKQHWDKQIIKGDVNHIMRQFAAAQKGTSSVVFFLHKPTDSKLVKDIFTEAHYQEAANIFWHKTGHQTQTPVSAYTSSVEMGTIAFKPSRQQCNWTMSTDPRDRHNHIEIPSVTTYTKDEANDPINLCEKPPALSKWIISNHVAPGGTVLIIGAGSGGDVMGALQAGVNVVAVERDEQQFKSLHRAMNIKVDHETKEMKKEQDEIILEERRKMVAAQQQAQQMQASGGSGTPGSGESATLCDDCGSYLAEGFDPENKCSVCINAGPLHPNCAHEYKGKLYCQTHLEELQDKDKQYEESSQTEQ
jgi:predicted RNA methylase